ncbi:hypothetical protein [Sphingomonas morindae]|uniref:Uncharacterized protein n=1 Tax=Sphingomonas morindae TaxID=1541170 RepID=A0ABY4X619_9SPHN|nr:hypothetical protein [Sphingomonas morindae]USI72352.1 hypothetical protein LHA26_13780 [Sphingomonas morindae]
MISAFRRALPRFSEVCGADEPLPAGAGYGYADWAVIGSAIVQALGRKLVIVECDRLTSSLRDSTGTVLLPSRAYGEALAQLGFEANMSVLAARDALLDFRPHPLEFESTPSALRLLSLENVLDGLSRCDLLILAGRAISPDVLSAAQQHILRFRPAIVLRSPPSTDLFAACAAQVAHFSGYRRLVLAAGRRAGGDAGRERFAVYWPKERPAPDLTASADDSTMIDLLPLGDAFAGTPLISDRPWHARLSISQLPARRGFWSVEREGSREWAWAGNGHSAGFLVEVPWPGNYMIRMKLYAPLGPRPSPSRLSLNGVDFPLAEDTRFITVGATLHRHAIVQFEVQQALTPPADPRRLTFGIESVEIAEHS